MGDFQTFDSSEPAETAIPRLLERHGGRLFRLGLRLCGDPQEAEDIVQETFLRAFRKWDQFEGRSDPGTWLYTIAIRVCRRLHRRRSGQPTRMESINELLPSGDEKVPDIPSRREGPYDAALRKESRETVEAAIVRLPLHFRLPLILKDILEFSIAQVSEVLGLKPATVKTRIHRARLFLRRELVRKLPLRDAPPPDHSRRMCLDLIRAKQEALDRGVDFPLADEELCSRCRAFFNTLDLAKSACRSIREGRIPDRLRQELLNTMLN